MSNDDKRQKPMSNIQRSNGQNATNNTANVGEKQLVDPPFKIVPPPEQEKTKPPYGFVEDLSPEEQKKHLEYIRKNSSVQPAPESASDMQNGNGEMSTNTVTEEGRKKLVDPPFRIDIDCPKSSQKDPSEQNAAQYSSPDHSDTMDAQNNSLKTQETIEENSESEKNPMPTSGSRDTSEPPAVEKASSSNTNNPINVADNNSAARCNPNESFLLSNGQMLHYPSQKVLDAWELAMIRKDSQDSDFAHASRMKNLKKDTRNHSESNLPLSPSKTISPSSSKPARQTDYTKHIQKFIAQNALVQLPDPEGGRKPTYWCKDFELKRYTWIDVEKLDTRFRKFLYNESVAQYQADSLIKMLHEEIPTLDQAGLKMVKKECLVFKDGVCNPVFPEFQSWGYNNLSEDELFIHISIPYSLFVADNRIVLDDRNATAPRPQYFENILDDMFRNEDKDKQEKMKLLAYQYIGALLMPTTWTKKGIFVFQGVSNAGKTVLADIICELLGVGAFYKIDDINCITTDNEVAHLLRCRRLLYITEASDKKIGKKATTLLKDYSDKSNEYPSPCFKILICTNYSLYTDNTRSLKDSLKNRINVLSFERPLDDGKAAHDYIEAHFSEEKNLIVIQALRAFHRFIQDGNKFITTCRINECVEYSCDEQDDQADNADETSAKEKIKEIKSRDSKSLPKLSDVLDDLYEWNDEKKLNYNLISEQIVKEINEVYFSAGAKEPVVHPQTILKELKSHFGDELQKKRSVKSDNKTYYNLKRRENNQ